MLLPAGQQQHRRAAAACMHADGTHARTGTDCRPSMHKSNSRSHNVMAASGSCPARQQRLQGNCGVCMHADRDGTLVHALTFRTFAPLSRTRRGSFQKNLNLPFSKTNYEFQSILYGKDTKKKINSKTQSKNSNKTSRLPRNRKWVRS